MKTFPRYKIVNETGIGNHTKIIDLETGEPMPNVRSITLHMDVDNAITATVEIIGVIAEVTVMDGQMTAAYAKVQTEPDGVARLPA